MAREVLPAVVLALALFPGTALAWSPGIHKEPIKKNPQPQPQPQPEAQTLDRSSALARLREGEALLETDRIGDGLVMMIEAYFALETHDGAEAAGVKELRSWLVKALETAGMTTEANTMRARGSFVDHPLTMLPSTWFDSAASQSTMTSATALASVEQGLSMLTAGDYQGLGVLVSAYEVIERDTGAESEDSIVLRSFLVGFLETGGFTEEAQTLRGRGSVTPATQSDTESYAAIWVLILAAEQEKANALSGAHMPSAPADPGSEPYEPGVEPEPEPEKKVEPGSVIPAVLIDLGVGSFQPEVARKGLLWSLGFDLRWTLFRAKFFGMQLGGGTQFSRNQKRWGGDAQGSLGLDFDFQKVYLTPEFGGGWDALGGTDAPASELMGISPAPYILYGGTLGVRFGEKFGMYARAIRVDRFERSPKLIPHETRLRAGFLIGFEKVMIDTAFVFTDYEPAKLSINPPGARLFSGNLGIRF